MVSCPPPALLDRVANRPRKPLPASAPGTGTEEEVWGFSWMVLWVLGVKVALLVVSSSSRSCSSSSSCFGVLSI